MSQFLLLLNYKPAVFGDFSPEQIQATIEEYRAWTSRLIDEKRLLGNNKLADDPGKIIHGEGGDVIVTDGPFSETKEMLGGYYVIEAEDYKAAIEIARTSPHMRFGNIVVREIQPLP